MPKIGELHSHTMSDAPPESSLTYWRVQVSVGGAVETLVFTESDIQKARARLAKHPAESIPVPEPEVPQPLLTRLWTALRA